MLNSEKDEPLGSNNSQATMISLNSIETTRIRKTLVS